MTDNTDKHGSHCLRLEIWKGIVQQVANKFSKELSVACARCS